MRGRERRRRSFDELGLLRICQRDSPLHLLYPERRRLFRRCRRFSRGVVSFRFSQCRLRGRHQPGGQPAVMAGTLGDFGGEVVWNWGPSRGTGGGPRAYEPRPPYQFLIKNMVGSSRGTPDSPPSPTPLPGCGSTTRNLSVGAPSVEPTFPLRYGRASSTRRVGSTTPRWPSTPKSTRAHPCSRKVLECLRTLPPAPAVSDPTSRASWPPKAETSAPGWAARSVISGSKPSQGPPSRSPVTPGLADEAAQANSSSSAFASFRSAVSKPSVNQP